MKNKPYVKKLNILGEVLNKIERSYMSTEPNRRERRSYLNEKPLHGCHKGAKLTILPIAKYKRVMQFEFTKTGKLKRIDHYILVK